MKGEVSFRVRYSKEYRAQVRHRYAQLQRAASVELPVTTLDGNVR